MVMPLPKRPGTFLRPSAQRSNHKKEILALRWAGQGLMAGWNEGYEGLGAVHPAPFNATRAVTGLWRCPRAAIGAVQKACGRALWTRPKPTASVTQASASNTFRGVGRLAANREKLFMTRCPKDIAVISRGEPAEGSAVGACGDHPCAVLNPRGLYFPFGQFLTSTRAPWRSVLGYSPQRALL